MATFEILGVTVDVCGVEASSRWVGHVVFTRDGSSVRGRWTGFDGSDMGELVDVEGEDEALCEFIDAHADTFESAITDELGSPSEDDGRTGMWAAVEQERAIHEARLGVVA